MSHYCDSDYRSIPPGLEPGITKTPASLREEADRLETEAAKLNKGTVWISQFSGMAIIHDGALADQMCVATYREATEAEITALCVIPEFAAYLKKVRGEA